MPRSTGRSLPHQAFDRVAGHDDPLAVQPSQDLVRAVGIEILGSYPGDLTRLSVLVRVSRFGATWSGADSSQGVRGPRPARRGVVPVGARVCGDTLGRLLPVDPPFATGSATGTPSASASIAPGEPAEFAVPDIAQIAGLGGTQPPKLKSTGGTTALVAAVQCTRGLSVQL
jgi:hypothetical protein